MNDEGSREYQESYSFYSEQYAAKRRRQKKEMIEHINLLIKELTPDIKLKDKWMEYVLSDYDSYKEDLRGQLVEQAALYEKRITAKDAKINSLEARINELEGFSI